MMAKLNFFQINFVLKNYIIYNQTKDNIQNFFRNFKKKIFVISKFI